MQLANHIAKEENFSQNILQGCNMSKSLTEQQQPYDKKKKNLDIYSTTSL